MHVTELDTFIDKLKQLWYCGLDAHLNVDTHAGQAWVGLRLRLGEVPPGPLHSQPPHKQKPPRHVGPAQHRRRERRQAARNAAEEVARRELGHTAADMRKGANLQT